jgi:hypothetical protein
MRGPPQAPIIPCDVSKKRRRKMTAPDPLQTVLTILSANWNATNTDSKTPSFIKITSLKRYDYNLNQDVVIAQRSMPEVLPGGIGPANKNEFERFNLDVRTIGLDQEQHWLNVQEEIKRILQSKKILPTSDYTILEFNGSGPDLSDKTHHLWRRIMPVQLERYNVSR